MEVTIISAQGLRNKTNLFSSRRIRPFTTLSTNINGAKHNHVYRTKSPLGWCQIPATDIVNEFFPKDGVRQLSYQLRNRDGSRGHGLINIEVKLTGLFHSRLQRHEQPMKFIGELPPQDMPETVIGIPVAQCESREFLSIINMHKLGAYQTQQRWYAV